MEASPPNDTVFATGLPDDLDDASLQALFEPHGAVKWCKVLKPANGKYCGLVQFETVEDATSVVENLNGASLAENMPPLTLRFKDPRGSSATKGGGKSSGGKSSWNGQMRPSPYSAGKQSQPAVSLIAPRAFLGHGSKGSQGSQGSKGGKGGKSVGKGEPGISELRKDLENSGKLPGGKWQNDEGALFISGLPKNTTEWDLYEIVATFGAIPTKGLKLMKNKTTGEFNGAALVNFIDPFAAQEAIANLDGTALSNGTSLKVSMKTSKDT